MAQNRELGELGQYLSVNTTSNVVSINAAAVSIGNTTVNSSINSTSLSVGTLSINSSGTTTNTFQIGTSTYFVSGGAVGIGTSSPASK